MNKGLRHIFWYMARPLSCFILLCLFVVNYANAQLPTIYLTYDSCSTEFSNGTFALDSPEKTIDAEIRFRGATSLRYTKKSFAIKLHDQFGEQLDTALLGMRADNSWLLDAMAIDKARMRNIVSFGLWNDFSAKPYHQPSKEYARNGIEGRHVEVYVNGEYQGIFCLQEKIDRKLLKLKKFKGDTIKGLLYKADKWTNFYTRDASVYKFDNTSLTWGAWYFDYPDTRLDEPIDWKPLSDFLRYLAFSSRATVNETLNDRIDIPVWQDFFLMTELLHADDNTCKNIYMYIYDITKSNMFGMCPWDMDATWGRNWISEEVAPDSDFINQNYINSFMVMVYTGDDVDYSKRYAQLRKIYFDPIDLKARFDYYFDLFKETGAEEREIARWEGIDSIHLDFDAERKYIHDWIDRRIEFLDKKYQYTAVDIQDIEVDNSHDSISSADFAYDLTGRKIDIKSIESQKVPHGIYIVKGRKIML